MRITKLRILVYMLSVLLGVHNGYIALWHGNDPQPIAVFPYRAAMLPESDQARLINGIRIEQESELYNLLEDYLS